MVPRWIEREKAAGLDESTELLSRDNGFLGIVMRKPYCTCSTKLPVCLIGLK